MPAPAWFISHGTPMMAFSDLSGDDADPYISALSKEARFLESGMSPLSAIVVVSAHHQNDKASESDQNPSIQVSVASELYALHDFHGFPGELYKIEYACKGDPDLAARIAGILGNEGFEVSLTQQGGMDHGVWIPLRAAFPNANVPIVLISLPSSENPKHSMKLGYALRNLREEGVLLMGSGGAVHNLESLVWHQKSGRQDPRAVEFEGWLVEQIRTKNVEALLAYEDEAPHSSFAHPSKDHLLPLFFTIGAALTGDHARVFHVGVEYSTLSMLSFSMEAPEKSLKH